MSRRRALAMAVVLLVVGFVSFAPRSLGPFTSISVLAQEGGEAETGAPTDLAIVALHCAEAPTADALTSYFATGAPPDACAPAVGVAIVVSDDEAALPGSPFRTDVAGSLVVPVGLGTQVEVAEDPESLPDGYEPLIGEANGVPYANPVRLDEAVAGAAVLFVNVPAPVAALAQEAGEPVALEDAASPAVAAGAEGNECDLAAPAARVAAAPAPLSVPSALGADSNTTGIGATSISTAGASTDVAGGNTIAVVSNPVRAGAGIWGWQRSHRSDNRLWRFDGSRAGDWRVHGKGLWLWPGGRAIDTRSLVFSGSSVRIGEGIWFLNWDRDNSDHWMWPSRFGTGHLAAARSGVGNLALVNNTVHIGDGIWRRPSHERDDDWRDHKNDSWTWGDDRDKDHDWRMNDRGIWIRSGAFASSGNGSVAVSAHGFRIGPGVWFWPFDRNHDDDWRWRAHNRVNDWFVHGNGVWGWPGRIGIDHVAAARSGNGSLAIVASSVRIGGHGVWLLPPGRVGHGDDWFKPRHTDFGIWLLSTAIARSSSGTLAISSHAVRIDTGVWRLPSDRDRDHHWLSHGGHARGNEATIEPQAVIASPDLDSPPGKLEPTSSVDQPAPASGEEGTIAAPIADPADAPGDMGQPVVETAEVVDNGGGAAASDEPVEAPLDVAASSTEVAPAAVDPAAVAPVAEPAPAAGVLDAGYVAPEPVYSEPAAVEPVIAPAAEAPVAAPSAEPIYVEPAPEFVEPAPELPNVGASDYLEPVFVEPAVDPGYVEPVVDPGFSDPGAGSSGSFVAEPIVDPGIAAPVNAAPAPAFVDPGAHAVGAPEPVFAAPSGGGPDIGDPGGMAPNLDHGGSVNGGLDNPAPITMEPDADSDPSASAGEDD